MDVNYTVYCNATDAVYSIHLTKTFFPLSESVREYESENGYFVPIEIQIFDTNNVTELKVTATEFAIIFHPFNYHCLRF